ncbi:MAG: hypothetical protein WBM86_22640 [Waterburya sp.]
MPSKKKARLNNANNPLNPTDSVLASFEQVSQLTSQPVNQSESQDSDSYPASNSHHFDKSASQPVIKSTKLPNQPSSLKKATFKIDSQILDSLDRYHLQLQIDLGKRNAPFKEIIVELAIKNILHQAQSDPELLLELLQQQQQIRS